MDSKRHKQIRFYENNGNDLLMKSSDTPSSTYKQTTPLTTSIRNHDDDENETWWKRTLDPSSEVALMWNRIFLVACIIALFIDPLFFYVPGVDTNNESFCMARDLELGGVVTIIRTITDVFYLLHVLLRFRTSFISPSTRVFGKGELVKDGKEIARRYVTSGFFIDFIAALPLPQIVIWFIIPAIKHSKSRSTDNALQLIVFIQYFPRVYKIFTLSSDIVKATGVVTKTAWGGASYNLLLYILASHVVGAAWYLMSIERYSSCWRSACRDEESPIKCQLRYLDCSTINDNDRIVWRNNTQVFTKCDPHNKDVIFDFGIFEVALEKGITSERFKIKYLYCLWFGVQQLSSFGQELETSTFILETVFCIVIAILGLILFALLIGNMETYLQSLTSRLEQWRLRKRDTEEWMKHRQLPPHLQQRVRRYVQYKWLATRGVNEEAILSSLPLDLRRDIQTHLCLDLIRRVPFFAQMDGQLLDAICERLKSSLNTAGTYIVREGDPVTEMLFIIRGKLESSTTDGGRSGFFNSITLRPGDFCGEELLAWALLPDATHYPSSTRTVKAIEEVEAFSLEAEHLKYVANQFRRLHSKKLQDTFRYYSHQWRSWGACFIQAAWRQYKRKMEQISPSLSSSSSNSQNKSLLSVSFTQSTSFDHNDEDHNDQSSAGELETSSLNIQRLARRFVRNARKSGQRDMDIELPKIKKPQDPNFFADH
ncbi:probable cyclic nucleotide-gated ion channel 14 isoform X1 [Chenopodium quinoa]|uniref:Cyclic nucleotide-binding domain-containing protein n=2 Tax=Chenopodium quinoa TaxID=63459 RepID=A0A803NE25_CHEQI|nr:probable cyclic nucleotide-gated ion channel 14 isoform X1 [Chenopodium quinoa]